VKGVLVRYFVEQACVCLLGSFLFEKNDAGTRLISLSDPDMLEEEKKSRIKLHERWFT
jgi:hypothetical protein